MEPHKRTAWLIRLWAGIDGTSAADRVPKLHIVGKVPDEVASLASRTRSIVCLPFLEDQALVSQFTAARALVFPSEIEGFGLPAIEAYYLGTPVCFTADTSIEEVLSVATTKGRFHLDDPASFFGALEEILTMSPEEIRTCGLKLREAYHSAKVVERMTSVLRSAGKRLA